MFNTQSLQPILSDMESIIIEGQKMYFFSSQYFEINNVKYRIIGSELTGPTWIDVIHTVKNLKSNISSKMTMKTLVDIFIANNLIQ